MKSFLEAKYSIIFFLTFIITFLLFSGWYFVSFTKIQTVEAACSSHEDCGSSYCDKEGDVENKYCSTGETVRGKYDYIDNWCELGVCYHNVQNNTCDCQVVDCDSKDKCVTNNCEYCKDGNRWKGDRDMDYFCSGGSCLVNNSPHGCNRAPLNDCQGNGCQDNGACDSTCIPSASLSCSKSNCGGGDCSTAYQPNSDEKLCNYTLINNSTDPDGASDIIESRWYVKEKGGSYSLITSSPCSGICDHTLQNRAAGKYIFKLEVEDKYGAVASAIQEIEIKREIVADFQCSLDPESNWQDCDEIEPSVEETLFLRDSSTLSEDASIITSWEWEKEGTVIGNNSTTSTNIDSTSLDIKLTTTDDDNRKDSKTYTINSSPPLPNWEETTGLIGLFAFLNIF